MKFLKLVNNKIQEVSALIASLGAADANKIVATDAAGRLDPSLMPLGFGAEVKVVVASENLTAGDFVNVWNDAGTLKCRRADASNGRKAHGYVLAGVTISANATVYYGNINNQLSGLTVGAQYVLSNTTPGGVVLESAFAPSTGHILQPVGVALSATEMLVEIGQEVTLS